jgi:hypothetical protein
MKPILLGLALGLLAGCASTPTTNAIPTSSASSSSDAHYLFIDQTAAIDNSAIVPDLSYVTIRSFYIIAKVNGRKEEGYVNATRPCKMADQSGKAVGNCTLETLQSMHIDKELVGLFTEYDARGSLCAAGYATPGYYHAYEIIPIAYQWTGKC